MAARQRHLRQAPITEALVDFRVSPPSLFDPGEVRRLAETTLAARYPDVAELRVVATKITGLKEGPVDATSEAGLRGLALRSPDKRKVAQFRFDGFTFNRLKPYTEWQEMQREALDLWSLYIDVCRPVGVSRVAVRYINHLTFPLADLSRYLEATPAVPADIGDYRLAGFLQRVALAETTAGVTAQVTQALEQSREPGQTTVILDIDVFRVVDYVPRDDRLAQALETMRAAKNRIFFSFITEEAARLWD